MTPKVSVIVPVYNSEDFLGECLDSLMMQTLEDIEIICVDDGSKDDSLSTLQGYSFLDSRLKVISIPHSGSAVARNKALAEAKGEYIYFANSYDLFDENMLTKMVQKAEADCSDIVIDGYSILNQHFREITSTEKLDENLLKKSPCTPKDLSDELFFSFPAVVWNKLIRTDVIHQLNLTFDASLKYNFDSAFNALLLAGAKKISLMNECLICHRINLNLHHKKDILQEFEDGLKAMAQVFHQMEKASLFSEFDMPYYLYLKKFIFEGLDNLTTDKRSAGLKFVLKCIPEKVLNHLIFPSKYEQKISIIIPVYNAGEFLSECLDSCLNQTLKDIEIICVNDGSTDNSLDILNEYAQKDERIKVVTQDNQGQASARNKAMEIASGTYIQFLDADDYLAPDACQMLYCYARIFRLDMLSFSAVEFKHKTREEFEDLYHTLSWLPNKFPSVFTWHMLTTDMPRLAVTACLTLYRRMFLLKNNLNWMNKKISFEDTPFFTEAVFNGARMGTLKETFYYRRVHSNSITQNVSSHFHDLIYICKHTLKLLQKMNVPKSIVTSYADTFLNKIYHNYLCFDLTDKEKEIQTLYKFCLYMLKKYHLKFSAPLLQWMQGYLKNKKLKKKLQFKYYAFCSKLVREKYIIPFWEFHKLPYLSIKVFSIPLLDIEIEKQPPYSLNFKIFGYSIFKIEEKVNG